MSAQLTLPDGTVWPNPDADHQFAERDMAHAYAILLSHPWGANISCRKLRWLRRAYQQFYAARSEGE